MSTRKDKGAQKIVVENKDANFDAVICCGGDGTLNDTIAGMIKGGVRCPLNFLPCGTTNDFARSCGIPREPIAAAKRILKGRATPFDVGFFETDDKAQTFSYVASFGLFADVSYATPQKIKNALGRAAYIFAGAEPVLTLFKAPEYKAEITANGKTYSGEYLYGSVSNSHSIGGVLKLDESLVSLNDGIFEGIFIRKPKDALQLNSLITALANNRFNDCPLIDFIQASEMSVKMNSVPWSLDGEKVDAGEEIKFKNLHSAVKIFI